MKPTYNDCWLDNSDFEEKRERSGDTAVTRDVISRLGVAKIRGGGNARRGRLDADHLRRSPAGSTINLSPFNVTTCADIIPRRLSFAGSSSHGTLQPQTGSRLLQRPSAR